MTVPARRQTPARADEDRAAWSEHGAELRKFRRKVARADRLHGRALLAEFAALAAREDRTRQRLADARVQQAAMRESWLGYKVAANHHDRRQAGLRVSPGRIV